MNLPDFMLRELAAAAVADGVFTQVSEVWEALVQGLYRVKDTFTSESGCYLVLSTAAPPVAPLRPVERRILERILRGDCQKHVAIDCELSTSTIATMAKHALGVLGVSSQPSRAPLAMVLLAQAERADREPAVEAKKATFRHLERRLVVVEMRRPDRSLASVLPPAEVAVVRARIEGCPHKVIADARHTSQRTIANQLASASRRLGASGRLETINRLLSRKGEHQPSALAS